MATDFIKGSVAKTGLIVTPKGRLYYPSVFKKSLPKGEQDESKAAYIATLLLPKSADLAILLKAVNQAIASEWGANTKDKIKKPFIKTEDQPRLAEYADEYPIMIRASNKKEKPKVVFGSLKPCEVEEEVYGGRWAMLSLNPYTWSHATGGKGVSWSLNHVMLLDHADPIGAGRVSVEDTFEAIEGEGDGTAESLF